MVCFLLVDQRVWEEGVAGQDDRDGHDVSAKFVPLTMRKQQIKTKNIVG